MSYSPVVIPSTFDNGATRGELVAVVWDPSMCKSSTIECSSKVRIECHSRCSTVVTDSIFLLEVGKQSWQVGVMTNLSSSLCCCCCCWWRWWCLDQSDCLSKVVVIVVVVGKFCPMVTTTTAATTATATTTTMFCHVTVAWFWSSS